MSTIYMRDRSSGRIHLVTRVGSAEQSFEADNLDAAGERDEITGDEFANADPDSLCRRCFPDHVTVTNEGA